MESTRASDDAPAPRPDAFECALLDAIAATTPYAGALRAQVDDVRVVRRDDGRDGRTTYFCVAAGTLPLADGELTVGVEVTLAGANAAGGSAELSLHNDWLDSLAVTVAAGAWPERPELGHVTASG